MRVIQAILLTFLLLSSNFLEINSKKLQKRHHLVLNSHSKRVKSKISYSRNLKEKISKTKFAPPLLAMVIINTGLQLITTIVNIAVKHQEEKLKNIKLKQLKRLYEFKSKADSIKRGVCISIIEVNAIFIDLFDWLRIETFFIRYVEASKSENILMGNFTYDKSISEEDRQKQEDRLYENMMKNKKICITPECIQQVVKVNSIDSMLETLKRSKNQLLEFQDQFCDIGRDMIGEETYYNARTKGILESIYPKKSQKKVTKILGQVWDGFNDMLGVLEEVTWVAQSSWDNYLAAEKTIVDAVKTPPVQGTDAYQKLEASNKFKNDFFGNNLISEVRNDYLPKEFGNQDKTWSGWYYRHVVIANPVYSGFGGLNTMVKNLGKNFGVLTGRISDLWNKKENRNSNAEVVLAVFNILKLMQPFIIYFIFLLSFGFMGGSKLINTFFSVFVFHSLMTSLFDFFITYTTIRCYTEKLNKKSIYYPKGPYAKLELKDLEKGLKDARKSKIKAIRSVVWYLFLLFTPFLFHAGIKWLMKKLLKHSLEAVTDLINGILFGILGFKMIKNVAMLILAVRKYYELKSRISKVEKEEDIEVKLRINYLGTLGVQLQYVFIKFNLVIYNGLTGFLTSFKAIIKDGNTVMADVKGENDSESEYLKKRAINLFGEDFENKAEEVAKKFESSFTSISTYEETEGLKNTAFKKTRIIVHKPRQYFLMNMATENVRLMYKYRKFLLTKYYSFNTDDKALEKFKELFDLFLHRLYFSAPIVSPMIFRLGNFQDTPNILNDSPLYVMKHDTMPDDYVCLYQKSFYSNNYLKDTKLYRFSLDETSQYNSLMTDLDKFKEGKDAIDVYFMNSSNDGMIYAIVFIFTKIFKYVDIQNFKIDFTNSNKITFMNDITIPMKIGIIPFFTETLYDKGENADGTVNIDLKTFEISNDPFTKYYNKFTITNSSPITNTANGNCKAPTLIGYYHVSCEEKNINGYHKLLLCASDELKRNEIKSFGLPKAETMQECQDDYIQIDELLPEEKDNEENNLIMDLRNRDYEGKLKENEGKLLKSGSNEELQETVSAFSINVRENACKQILKLKHIIYGCQTDLIARKKEFVEFLGISEESDISIFKNEFYYEKFYNPIENKLEQPTLSQFRDIFHNYVVRKCGISMDEVRTSNNNVSAFGFAFAHSEAPENIEGYDGINSKLQKIGRRLTIKNLKGKYLFDRLDSRSDAFDELLLNNEKRFLFPMRKKNKENSLIFTVYYILPISKNSKEDANSRMNAQIVYALQDVNEEYLNSWNDQREVEKFSIEKTFTGKSSNLFKATSLDTEINNDKADVESNDANADSIDSNYTVRMAKMQMGPTALFKTYEYYYMEVWTHKPKPDKDNNMFLSDDKGVIEGLIGKGFLPYWPKTLPVITTDSQFERDYKSLEMHFSDYTINETDDVDYLKYYKELEATPDFFFFFQYHEGSSFKGFFSSKYQEKTINYRIWGKYDFDMSKVEFELECQAQE